MNGDLFVPRPIEELALEWPPELDHFSASSAKMAVRCSEQWRQRYVLGKKAPPNINMIGGKADHQAIEKSMRQKIESHVDLPVKDVTEEYVRVVEESVEEAGGLNELEWREDQNPVKEYDATRIDGQKVVEAYHKQASSILQPLAVEEEFEILVPGLPVKVIGYIDLIAKQHEQLNLIESAFKEEPTMFPSDTRIVERKRRKRASTKIEPEWSIAAEIYQLAHPLPHDWHISTYGTKTPSILLPNENPTLTQRIPKRERSELMLQQIVAQIGWLYMRYGPDTPWPAGGRLHPWACGFCAWKPTCWAWA